MTASRAAPAFRAPDGRDGVEVVDPVTSARFAVYTPSPVTPRPASTDAFRFPVDAAVAVDARAVEVPKLGNVLVRTGDGRAVFDGAVRTERTLPPREYALELSTAPLKLYLTVESELHLRPDDNSVTVGFGGETTLRVGARSFRERPRGTVTVPEDVEAEMRAVSLLGAALKTTSPERSFPTLRGFPPLLERGESFAAPDGLSRPATDVRLVLPATRSALYPAAPLAFYLGAEVVPGDRPRIEAAGREFPLAWPDGYERAVHRALQQAFVLDCVVRTEGRYRVALDERERVAPRLDRDVADLYDLPPAERAAAYLATPYGAVADAVPEWSLTADVRPAARNLPALPYLAADLALIRCPERPSGGSVEPQPEALTAFYRGPDEESGDADGEPGPGAETGAPAPDGGVATREGEGVRDAGTSAGAGDGAAVFTPPPADTVEHAWVGEGYPVGANKLTVGALRRGVDWTPADDGPVSVRVVCNDEAMRAESAVAEYYGLRPRDLLSFDVAIRSGLTTDELAALLADDVDLLHYVGHVDDDGMQCVDGSLDARRLDDVGVRTFLLNACRSYEQGEALVGAGSLGGVVTLADVPNRVATDLGWPLARLLNCGFTLRGALAVAREEVLTAGRYVTVGDGGVALCQSESGAPTLLRVERVGDDAFAVEFVKHSTRRYGLGSMFCPVLDGVDRRYLGPGSLDRFEVSGRELRRCLDLQILPVEVDGDLRWSDDLSLEEI